MTYYAVFDTNVLVSSLLTKNEDAATAKVIYEIPSEMMDIIDNEWYCNYYELHDYFKQTLGSAFLFIVFTYKGC